ncbi:MAG: T9SS type A sorting domain-containing protein [Candidatus Zixiibacteriota bacterium]
MPNFFKLLVISAVLAIFAVFSGISAIAETMDQQYTDKLHFSLGYDEILIVTSTTNPDTIALIDFSLYYDSAYSPGYMDKVNTIFYYNPDEVDFVADSLEISSIWDGGTYNFTVNQNYLGTGMNRVVLTLDDKTIETPLVDTIFATFKFKVFCDSPIGEKNVWFDSDDQNYISISTTDFLIDDECSECYVDGIVDIDADYYDLYFKIHDTTLECGALGQEIDVPIYIWSTFKVLLAGSTVNYDTTKLEFISYWLPDSSVWEYPPDVTTGAGSVTVNLSNYGDTSKPLQYDDETIHYYLKFKVRYDHAVTGPWDGEANYTTLSFNNNQAGGFVSLAYGGSLYCLGLGYLWPAYAGDMTVAEYEADFAADFDCGTCGSGSFYSGKTVDTVMIKMTNSFPAGGAPDRLVMNIDLGDKFDSPDILDTPFDMDAEHDIISNVLNIRLDDNTVFDCDEGDLFRLELELDTYTPNYNDRFAVLTFLDQYPDDTSLHSLLIDTTTSVQVDTTDHLTFTADSIEILQAEFSTTSASTNGGIVSNYLKLRNNFEVAKCTVYVTVPTGWSILCPQTYSGFTTTKISNQCYKFYLYSGTKAANGDNYTTIARIYYSPPWTGQCQINYTTPNINGYSAFDGNNVSHYTSEVQGQVGANPCGTAAYPCGGFEREGGEYTEEDLMPGRFNLHPNRPNPFNPTTIISYDVPVVSHVTIDVINILGQRIITLVDEEKAPGSYEVIWNATDENGARVASGIYLYNMRAGEFTQTQKMMLMK